MPCHRQPGALLRNRRELRQRAAVLAVDGLRYLGWQQSLGQPELPALPQHHERRASAPFRVGARADRRRAVWRMASQVRSVSPGAVRLQTFRQVVEQLADEQPDATFLLAPESGASVTYAELRRTTRRFGALLGTLRVPEQGIVAFMLPNGLAAATIFVGSMTTGRIVSPINLLAQD